MRRPIERVSLLLAALPLLASCIDKPVGYDQPPLCGAVYPTQLWEDFEDLSLVAAEWTFTGEWEAGVPAEDSGEPRAYDGAACLGTRLGGTYRTNQQFLDNLAISPKVDLCASERPVLSFQRWLAVETCCDGANVWVRPEGGAWTLLQSEIVPYTQSVEGIGAWSGSNGTLRTWQGVSMDLSAWAGQVVQVAFALSSDQTVSLAGTYIDDVYIGDQSRSPHLADTMPWPGEPTDPGGGVTSD